MGWDQRETQNEGSRRKRKTGGTVFFRHLEEAKLSDIKTGIFGTRSSATM